MRLRNIPASSSVLSAKTRSATPGKSKVDVVEPSATTTWSYAMRSSTPVSVWAISTSPFATSSARTSASMNRVRFNCARIGVATCRTSSAPELTSGSIGVKSEKFSRLTRTISAAPRASSASSFRATAIPAKPPPRITMRGGRDASIAGTGSLVNEHDPIEGELLSPSTSEPTAAPAPAKKKARGIGTIGAMLAVLALKFKAVILFLLQFKFAIFGLKLLAGSWTFLLSLWVYVVFFGWRLGVVILLAIAAHELGHFFAYRAYGLPVRLPVFVPLLGAYTQGAIAPELEQDAYIALAGPLTGLALAGACEAVAVLTGDRFWYACADIGAFINLFNMIPVPPFDGGRVIGAVWPGMWILGIVLFAAAAVFLHVPIFMVLLVGLLGLPAMIASFRGQVDPRAAAMTNAARFRVSLWYLATIAALIVVLGQAHAALPANGLAL